MEPLLALFADWWWIGPAAAGAGTVGWVGVRRTRRRVLTAGASAPGVTTTGDRAARAWASRPLSKSAARRLELDAAQLDLQNARLAVTRGRADVKVADAEVVRAQAERAASRVSADVVAAARARLIDAQRDLRAAAAEVRARRAGVKAAKAMLPAIRSGTAPLPIVRLLAEHDAILARWMAYETDLALAIDYPVMTDPRSPLLAEFLRAHERAQWLRPATPQTRLEPAEFLAYRDAVRRAAHAFDRAEQAARRGPQQPSVEAGDAWGRVASDLADTAQRALARSLDSMGRAAARSWTERGAKRTVKTDPASEPPAPSPGPTPNGGPVWPPPARDRPHPPAS
ncbi:MULTISPECIES: hypothetical protein [Microbacterium]|uniref:hypothetical protein n=1 Tax=Microbacterium TaxID=33882 RepID=UPI0027874229|nr:MULTISPECIES: hypothetical protein [Microbacterium]MDQ1082410.1 hypothetical protein [Microbacterium sp. SORGH_AS_0344]MDQ1168819.1 hypothetical protein [Microbacterium proteolyticum]